MRVSSLVVVCAFVLTSCAHQYLYRFPTDVEYKRYKPEDVRWSYTGTRPDTVIVTDGERLYRLPVTDKTKLEVHTVYNEKYLFQLQSIAITGEGDFLGTTQMWRGYDILSHAERTVQMKDITNIVVVSAVAAIPK